VDQETINRAYSLGLGLKSSALSELELIESLTLQGVPEKLAKQVAVDIQIERQNDHKGYKKRVLHYGMLSMSIAIIAFIVVYMLTGSVLFILGSFLFPGLIMVVYGLW